MAHDDPFAGKTVNADWGYFLDTSGTYTPALTGSITDPNLGADGTIVGWWHRNGHWIEGGVELLFSGTGVDAGSGQYSISLPFDPDATIMTIGGSTLGQGSILGSGLIRDNSSATTNSRPVVLALASATEMRLFVADGVTTIVSDSSPFTWADGDRIAISFAYPADPTDLPS